MPASVPLTARFRLILVPEKENEKPQPSDWPANAIDVGIVTVPINVSFAQGGPVMRGAATVPRAFRERDEDSAARAVRVADLPSSLPSSRDPELDEYVRSVIAERTDPRNVPGSASASSIGGIDRGPGEHPTPRDVPRRTRG